MEGYAVDAINNLAHLDHVINTLLSENGCPWDKKQTHKTLKRYLIEECYEVVHAIDNDDDSGLCEELGDVLFQLLFHAKLKEREGKFDINDVIDSVKDKMIYRHPHVFSDVSVKDTDEVLQNWDKIKQIEKDYKSNTEILRSVPEALPALMRAEKVINKAHKLNDEFIDIDEVLRNTRDIICKLTEGQSHIPVCSLEEFGQLFFDLVTISTKFEINPEFALTNATEKFINRFEQSENISISYVKI
jgi:tetrapyrrole methylase family protein/MazG family protein